MLSAMCPSKPMTGDLNNSEFTLLTQRGGWTASAFLWSLPGVIRDPATSCPISTQHSHLWPSCWSPTRQWLLLKALRCASKGGARRKWRLQGHQQSRRVSEDVPGTLPLHLIGRTRLWDALIFPSSMGGSQRRRGWN